MKPALAILAAAIFACVPALAGAAPRAPIPVKVLLIGDSLSVDAFGKDVQESLVRNYGENQVAVFASCGSSPEDWISGDFVTHCGYRQATPSGSHSYDRAKTPTLRAILSNYRPRAVIVQLGTNWMDALSKRRSPDEGHYRGIIRKFVSEIRRGSPYALIVWVLPPASSVYPPQVHGEVEGWIKDESRRMGFDTINSRQFTKPYRPGVTGGDGVHYREEAAGKWARGVLGEFYKAARASGLAPAGGAR